MEFGILFTSHPNTDVEPYPHRDVHARVTHEILRADELGYDWVGLTEHHFGPFSLTPNPAVFAGAMTQVVKRAKIALLGSLVPC